MMRNPKLDPYIRPTEDYIPKSAPFKANILNPYMKTNNLNDRTKHASASHLECGNV
ncbi:hypothetical protein SPFM12_00213 [Salmonella phage SPFM12]|nr:hypothetical protein SPFM12_00213 [Salmonella phage SPFM12]